MDKKSVGERLMQEGIKPHLDGFRYILDAVVEHDDNERTCNVYAEIAKKHGIKPQNVERAIRTAKKKSEKYKSCTSGQMIAMIRWELQHPERRKCRSA